MTDRPADPPGARLPYAEFVAMAALLMALNAMALDIILPALQQMGESLGVADANARQWPISAYIAAFGLSQLIYGPLSDRFGRRKVLMFGLAIYVLGCFGAALAGSFTLLLAMRAVQGIGAGATRVIAMAVVRDTFSGRRMASVMSLAMMVFMTVPVFAPTIGQGILMIAGWRALLFFIAAAGIAMAIWCDLRLPETLDPANRRELRPKPIIEGFRIVLTNRIACAYALGTALIFGCLFGFLNSAQQIYQGIYGLGALFPLAFSASAIFIALASFTNSRIVERLGMRKLSHLALAGYAGLAALISLIAVIDGGHVPFVVFFGLTLLMFSLFGFIGTNFNALAMEPLGRVAGTAASVLGCLQTFLGGVLGGIVGYFYDGTVLPLSVGFLVLSTASFLLIALVERGNLFGRESPA